MPGESDVLAPYLAGLALGFGLITPIGPQNVFVVGQGLSVGFRRAVWAVIAAGCCDTTLIIAGAAGVSGLLTASPAARTALLLAGAIFLSYLGTQALRRTDARLNDQAGPQHTPRQIFSRSVSVSLLNPHAILDTIGVIGTAVVAQPPGSRAWFAVGVISSSWLWFLFLAGAATRLRRYLRGPAVLWFDRFSGTVMLVFAAAFLIEFIHRILH
jgi:L-lysine exporter family protein LysE/ArgO